MRAHGSTAGSKAARTELVRILIAKDMFDGCEAATKAVYRALVAAARQWATEEQVTAVCPRVSGLRPPRHDARHLPVAPAVGMPLHSNAHSHVKPCATGWI